MLRINQDPTGSETSFDHFNRPAPGNPSRGYINVHNPQDLWLISGYRYYGRLRIEHLLVAHTTYPSIHRANGPAGAEESSPKFRDLMAARANGGDQDQKDTQGSRTPEGSVRP